MDINVYSQAGKELSVKPNPSVKCGLPSASAYLKR